MTSQTGKWTERMRGLNWRQTLSDVAIISAGAMINALSFNLFFIPNNVVTGGIAGLAVILHRLLGWPVGLMIIAMNVPLFVAALRWAGGLRMGLRTVYAVVVFSLAIDLLAPYVSPVTDNPLLYVAYGGLMSGAGLGLVFRAQGTTGGTDIIARLLRRLVGWPVSRGVFVADALIIGGAALVFGLERAMYGIIVLGISAWAIDVVLAGGRRARQAMVISSQWEAVRDMLLHELGRGVTVVPAHGAYTGEERPLLLCIINSGEVARLRRLVQAVDAGAFVVVGLTSEVWGEGFDSIHDLQ